LYGLFWFGAGLSGGYDRGDDLIIEDPEVSLRHYLNRKRVTRDALLDRIRYCEFPDDAPVHDGNALLELINQHTDAQGDPE
jgi:hypothetical protein